MARVTYAPVVGNASGRAAGVVFSIWRGISYVKRFVKPGNPNTALQQSVRNAFKALTVVWKKLDSVLVTQWTNYSAGKGFTNRNAFLGENVPLEVDSNPLTVSPHNPAEFPVVLGTITPGADQFTVNWTYPDALTSNRCRIYYRKSAIDEMVFVSEELNTITSKVVTGFTGTGGGKVYLVKRNNTTTECAESVGGAFTWT